MLVYWHCISAPVLLANILLFSSFVKVLCFGIWSDDSAAKTSTRQKQGNFITTLKMFFILGIPYICDLIAWSLEWAYGRTSQTILTITSVLKALNASQGFIMFCVIIFDSSKIKTLYNLTMSYRTRSAFMNSLSKRKEVSCETSKENRTTYLERGKELNVDDNRIRTDSKKLDNSKNIIELHKQPGFEITDL